ncbi:hypothetical protein [Streptomyces sp. PU-14G]|uniref:hypothetical protein n=1 Tax=Streptomyces sp. PU-14G TaxID=2800808 RepID=UPI0034DE2DE2
MSVGGDLNVFAGSDPSDEAATERVLPPRFREGPYPAQEIAKKLRGFIAPPVFDRCLDILGSPGQGRGRVLLLRGGGGDGATTTAFALLRYWHGEDGVTGLDTDEDPAAWTPIASRGYLLRNLSQAAADKLTEVTLTTLADRLAASGSCLVITVGGDVELAKDSGPWQVEHEPPLAREVAESHLLAAARAGMLTAAERDQALGQLSTPALRTHLDTGLLPPAAADVAEALREAAVSGKQVDDVLGSLRHGDDKSADDALREARHSADSLALLAAVSLLERQDRTVVAQFAATVRGLLTEWTGPEGGRGSTDLLGTSFEHRLKRVGAGTLPPRFVSAPWRRHRMQPVAFHSRHRATAVLRRLCLDYEGFTDVLWQGLHDLPYQPGVDLAAGAALGRVLTYATGPGALRRLRTFAESALRWKRRLAAYAIGEVGQHVELAGATHDHLRQWSRQRDVNIRCTVAEVCAGSYGLARPSASLTLLDNVLSGEGSPTQLEPRLRNAVTFALGVLLTEDANVPAVLDRLVGWLEMPVGSLGHAYAVHAVDTLCRESFPGPRQSGVRRIGLAQVLGEHSSQAMALVALGLDDSGTHAAVAEGLSAVEYDPAQRRRASFESFLRALPAVADGNRGVTRFLLTRYRHNTLPTPEGTLS